MPISQNQKWLIGGAVFSVMMITILIIIFSGKKTDAPPELDARAVYAAQKAVASDQDAFESITDDTLPLLRGEWFSAMDSQVPDALRSRTLKMNYTPDVKFVNEFKGRACVVVTVEPEDMQAAREATIDKSNLVVKYLIYWKKDSDGDWVMDTQESLQAFRLDNSEKLSPRAGNRNNFRQLNQ